VDDESTVSRTKARTRVCSPRNEARTPHPDESRLQRSVVIVWSSRNLQLSMRLLIVMVTASGASRSARADDFAAPLPRGVEAVWDLSAAYHETTPSRERICLNGLWRWQPARTGARQSQPPGSGWGYFRILAPQLDSELRPRYGPTVRWCDIPVPRV